jgi:hypothetical protein
MWVKIKLKAGKWLCVKNIKKGTLGGEYGK